MTQQNKYVLYLGLADKDTKKQQMTTSKAMKLVNQVVGNCTINKSKGYWQGFRENTLAIEILFCTLDQIKGYCEQLKTIFNQECIAIQEIQLNQALLV